MRSLREVYALLGVRYIDGTGWNEEAGVVDASVDSLVGNVYASSLEIRLRDMAHPRATHLVETFEMAGWKLSHDSLDYLSFVPQLQDGHASTNDRIPGAFKEPPRLPIRIDISGREPPEPLLPSQRAFILFYIWLRSYGFEVSTSGLIQFWRSCRGLEMCNNFAEEFYVGLKYVFILTLALGSLQCDCRTLMTYPYFGKMLYDPAGSNQLPLHRMKRITYQLKAIFGREKTDFQRYVEFERISAFIFGPHIRAEILNISPETTPQLMSEGHTEDGSRSDAVFNDTRVSQRQGQVNRWQTTKKSGADGPWRESVKSRFEGGQLSRKYTTQTVVEGTTELLDPPPAIPPQIPQPTGLPHGVQNEDETLSPSIPECASESYLRGYILTTFILSRRRRRRSYSSSRCTDD